MLWKHKMLSALVGERKEMECWSTRVLEFWFCCFRLLCSSARRAFPELARKGAKSEKFEFRNLLVNSAVVRKNRIFEIQINLADRFFLFRKNHRAQSVVSMPTA